MPTIVHNPSQYFGAFRDTIVVRGQAGAFEVVLPPTPTGFGCFGLSDAGYLCVGSGAEGGPNRIVVTDDFVTYQDTASVLYSDYNYVDMPTYSFQGHDGLYAVSPWGRAYKATDGRTFSLVSDEFDRLAYCNGIYLIYSDYTLKVSTDAASWVTVSPGPGQHVATFRNGTEAGVVTYGAAWSVSSSGAAIKIADKPLEAGDINTAFYSAANLDHAYVLFDPDPDFDPPLPAGLRLYRVDSAGFTLAHVIDGLSLASGPAYYVDGFLYLPVFNSEWVPWIYEIDPVSGTVNPVLEITAYLGGTASFMVLPGGEIPVQLFWTSFNLTYEIP